MGTSYTPTSIQSGFQSNDLINSEYQAIQDELARMVNRFGDAPNFMEAELDMNSHRILNVLDGTLGTDGVNLNQVIRLATDIANAVSGSQNGNLVQDFTNSNPLTFNFRVASGSQGLNNRTEFDLAALFGVGLFQGITVFINGVFQTPGLSYSTIGSIVTFTEPLDADSTITFIFGDISPTPSLSASNLTVNETAVVATAGQLVFTTPTYVIGQNHLLVFIDGIAQSLSLGDFTETTTTSITLDVARVGGERVVVRSLSGA